MSASKRKFVVRRIGVEWWIWFPFDNQPMKFRSSAAAFNVVRLQVGLLSFDGRGLA